MNLDFVCKALLRGVQVQGLGVWWWRDSCVHVSLRCDDVPVVCNLPWCIGFVVLAMVQQEWVELRI